MKVAVIGAGPSGLVTLRYLISAQTFLGTEPIEALLFKSEDTVGGTFQARTYEDGELVSSKQLTSFSDFRLRDDDPDFVSAKRYVEYLHEYCDKFNLWSRIKLSTAVVSVKPNSMGKGHIIAYPFVCSGLHVTPNLPEFPGLQEHVPLHTYLAVTSPTKKVVMCHRSGFHFAPKGTQNSTLTVPLDNARASLFDTAYVHLLLRNSNALWTFYDWYIIGEPSPDKNHVSKTSPYISYPYRLNSKKSLVERVRSGIIQSPIPSTNGRQIDLAPWPESVSPDGKIHFQDNGRPGYQRVKDKHIKPDIVVCCTGYKQRFPFLDRHHYRTAEESNVWNIWHDRDPTVGFIGFLRPSLGAIPPLAEMQAQLWILKVVAPERVPELRAEDEPHYRLLHGRDSRVGYGIDHESYVYQLALDMNSATGFTEIVKRAWERKELRLVMAWALGRMYCLSCQWPYSAL
ncbi:hypothetical protein QBC41DRAFT_363349 [Cercophora samala]|uniref:Uncharacterized protein n=1 Tax=Cercophora samala TaxID=330535 RepID=A0AA40DDQ3_9PEZI|nr:hypothetical protein QBC41DRAFT_363349 [Cercophora samala]